MGLVARLCILVKQVGCQRIERYDFTRVFPMLICASIGRFAQLYVIIELLISASVSWPLQCLILRRPARI